MAVKEDKSVQNEILIGVSACLMGQEVRWDGGHKRDRFLTDTLADFVRFVPVCPEFDLGLGTPRETLRLEASPEGPRLVENKSKRDLTARMDRYASKKSRELERQDLSGFIFKKDSPSCGLFRVRVYGKGGSPARNGRGLFAETFAQRNPLLPIEEEGRLNDPPLRENFLERVFAYRRLRDFFAGRWRVGDLVEFHTNEKLLLFAHKETAYRALGRVVADAKQMSRKELAKGYQGLFMDALGHQATVRRHVNVLQHAAGYFKKDLESSDRTELARLIDDYRKRLVPLVVPLTMVRHYVRALDVEYLSRQTYLSPHPKELMLRNHV